MFNYTIRTTYLTAPFHFRSISHKVSLIKGDGIGPEIAASVKKVFATAKVYK